MGNEMDELFLHTSQRNQRENIGLFESMNLKKKCFFFCGWNQLMSQIALIVVERSIIPLYVFHIYFYRQNNFHRFVLP